MRRLFQLILPSLLLLVVSVVISTSVLSSDKTMDQLTVENVEEVFQEKGRLVMLWSVDCPPCYQELAMLETLLASYPELPITLISTDDDPERHEEVEEQYRRLKGNKLSTWVFSDGMATQLRYAIDKTWSGVLPRSYVVKAAKRIGHSGVLKEKDIRQLFALPKH
jgi:thiol-disulfide isomerase/thioredoxin